MFGKRQKSKTRTRRVFRQLYYENIYARLVFRYIGNYPANKVQSQTKREKNSGPVSSEAWELMKKMFRRYHLKRYTHLNKIWNILPNKINEVRDYLYSVKWKSNKFMKFRKNFPRRQQLVLKRKTKKSCFNQRKYNLEN